MQTNSETAACDAAGKTALSLPEAHVARRPLRVHKKIPWRPIKTCRTGFREEVDLWMQWGASPLTMGIADSFRVPNAYRLLDEKWWHFQDGEQKELNRDYITHWMRIPKPPRNS